ncbi:hypothetical protein OSB04_031466 [Centaurea solstitialis]|uniref:Reverse transcriptase Ty1/copia-type domain-containing protein n=1 Tax=Centaurea solstitialis TaxID=347529 RepID=A0AA38SUR0_9ASTR|nr:hypothetical protein OSB04_031466 [Centaurea solstitialis]
MEQPEGFVDQIKENRVYKLVKSLYGLKQAPKQWHQKFDQAMLENVSVISVKDTTHGYVILCLYVDDMLIIGGDNKMIRLPTPNPLNPPNPLTFLMPHQLTHQLFPNPLITLP